MRMAVCFAGQQSVVDPHSGNVRRHHVSDTAIQDVIEKTIRKAGIPKFAAVHTPFHGFATHLLRHGVNLREVQELLSHADVETTAIYAHVMSRDIRKLQSPPDRI